MFMQAKSIICGLEPEKTRSLLQLLCVAARTKGGVAVAAAAAISRVRFSEAADGVTAECAELCKVSGARILISTAALPHMLSPHLMIGY